MAQRSHVPKFGNWEGEESVPYTAYFEKARKGPTGVGGKMINPNDPQENEDVLSEMSSSAASPPKARPEPERPIHERRRSREDSDLRQYANSPGHRENVGRKTSGEAPVQNNRGRGVSSGESYRRPRRPSTGPGNSVEKSPQYANYPRHHESLRRRTPWDAPVQNNRPEKGPAVPKFGEWDENNPKAGPAVPKFGEWDENSPTAGPAVPKFGEWDENNPTSADGFTHIFNKVREEKTGKVPGTPSQPAYDARKPAPNDTAKICCFPWGRK